MIISASRRTDIPAFYAKWFVNRIADGRIAVRNPMNIHQITEWRFNPDTLDCIVFWTKNAAPIIPFLKNLDEYNYYFQFTLNPYGKNIESLVPEKKLVINTFKKLSDLIGPDRVIWRYDPILFNPEIGFNYHLKYFEVLARFLEGYTNNCVISFLDVYKRIESRLRKDSIMAPEQELFTRLARNIAEIGKSTGISIKTCSESVDLSSLGIEHSSCIDKSLIEKITGKQLDVKKDPNQRKECGCIQSVDIGQYNSCPHRCSYCYATFSETSTIKNQSNFSEDSLLMIGNISEKDIVSVKEAKSLTASQPSLFG